MTEKWQQTDLIVMAVQTAELRQAGVREKPRLNLSCSLVNIARGQCMLEVSAGQVSDNSEVGELVIEIDRPVMQGVITIPGTGTPAHMKENLEIFDFELSEAEMRQIDSLPDDLDTAQKVTVATEMGIIDLWDVAD